MGNVVFVIHRPTKQVVASGVRTALAVSSQSELSEALAGKASIAQGAKADTAVQPEALAAVAISGAYADLAGLPSIPSTPGSIGAATSEQGAKADTAVQPSGAKVLSDQNYTLAEKEKLEGLSAGLVNPMTAQGDLLVGGAAGAPIRVPIGLAGQVPTVNAARNGYEFKTPAAGGGGGGGSVVIGADYPVAAPPSVGATYIFGTAIYTAIGTAHPENWHQISGRKYPFGGYVAVGTPLTVNAGRMDRWIHISSGGTPGQVLPVAVINFPRWMATPSPIVIDIYPGVDGIETKLSLDFGTEWSYMELSAAPLSGVSIVQIGNALAVSASTTIRLEMVVEVDDTEVYVEIRPIARPRMI